MVCKLCLKDDIVGLVLRFSSRLFHILIADCIHYLVETFVRVNSVEKILLFLKGYPKIQLSNGGIKSTIYVGTFPLLTLCIKYNFCW